MVQTVYSLCTRCYYVVINVTDVEVVISFGALHFLYQGPVARSMVSANPG